MNRNFGKRIARTAAAGGISDQDAAFDQRHDVTQRSVLRAFREFGPFRRSQLPLEVIQQPVEDKALALVKRKIRDRFPEARFGEYRPERDLRAFDSSTQAAQEPIHPESDINRTLLGLFQDLVVGSA